MSAYAGSECVTVRANQVKSHELFKHLQHRWEHVNVCHLDLFRLSKIERLFAAEIEGAIQRVSALSNLPAMQKQLWRNTAPKLEQAENMGWQFMCGSVDDEFFIFVSVDQGGPFQTHEVCVHRAELNAQSHSLEHLFVEAVGAVLRRAASMQVSIEQKMAA